MFILRPEAPNGVQPVAGGRYRLTANQGGGEIPVTASPFLIGRSPDCHVVLPEDQQLRTTTSRWHCYLLEQNGTLIASDGTYQVMTDTGQRKPSVTGTLINGKRISGPTTLANGDVLGVGPWRFVIKAPATVKVVPPAGGDVMDDVARGVAKKVEGSDPKLKEKFGQMHELVQRLAQIPDTEESLTALLSYSTMKISAAEVAAILMVKPGGGFTVRLAWQKGLGKDPNFKFSESLLTSLPPDQSFLLESKLKDRSASQSVHDISSGLLLPLWAKGERLGVFYLDNRRTGNTFTEEDLYLASALASLVSLQLALEQQSQLAKIEENMARYFAPDVVQRIVQESASGKPVGLDVQEKDITVLFVDMEGFTKLSRTKTPREISEMLNPYLETIARCIMNEGGHVNKFIGDAVMGIFGANPGQVGPSDPVLYAAQSVRAALAMPLAWEQEAVKRRLPPMRIRIGINSGRAVVGNIGFSARMEFSVLGDAVNQASRMEKQASPNRAAVSQATHDLVADQFEFEELGDREVKGVGIVKVFSPVRVVGVSTVQKPA
jgi:adenylate cyclase